MNFIEEVQIPLVVLPPPESCRLVRWCVPDGSHVTMGRVIFELEVGTEVYEIESFHTGFLKISGTPGDSYKIGDCIGTMVCEQMPEGLAVFGIELASSDVSKLDRLRGGRSRREYLMDLVRTALNAQASE